MLFSNYKKSFEDTNKIIDTKMSINLYVIFDKNLKLIGLTFTGKVININWESNINNDFKLDNKNLEILIRMK